MPRVLHVHNVEPDVQTSVSLRMLGATKQNTRTIGRGGTYANLAFAVLGLRREVGQADVVHVWDDRSFDAAWMAGGEPILYTLGSRPPRQNILRNQDAVLVRTSDLELPRPCPLIRPAVPEIEDDRARIRNSLGFDDDDFVLLAPGESDRPAAHERAVWAGSILHVTDERYRVLLWGRGPRLRIASGLGDKLRQVGLVVVANPASEFSDLIPAADAMLVTATGPAPTLPVAMAMAVGVPVIAAQRPEFAGFVLDGETALTAATCTPRLLAQRVLDLRADEALRSQITSNARERVCALFSAERFITAYQALYDQLLAGRDADLLRPAL
jgi:glycosyltransferase involved in cell wall biosynthesis